MTINFNTLAEIWRKETFMAAAFNEMEDFNSFLDSPECGVGNPFFDEYADEINDIIELIDGTNLGTAFNNYINTLELLRKTFVSTKEKKYWRELKRVNKRNDLRRMSE